MIIPEVEEEPLEVQITEYTLEEIVIDTGALNDIEEEEEEEETSDNNTSSEDDNSDKDSVNQAQQDEKVVNSLAIDTKQIHPQDQTEEEEFSASAAAADHPTSLSSSSSIVPPLTPSSIHSVHNHSDFADQNYQKRPRTTSLIRRETNKFNDRRKSLTKKLKRALTVKTENKRNSV